MVVGSGSVCRSARRIRCLLRPRVSPRLLSSSRRSTWWAGSTGQSGPSRSASGARCRGPLVGMAQSQLLGGAGLVSLDRQRADVAAVELSAVPVLASTTAAGLARRFGPVQLAGVETAAADLAAADLAAGAFDLLPARRRVELSAKVTLDLDSTDVEVYGSKKQGVAYNYAGQRCGRPHLATWAEAGLSTAADLLAGNDDVRPRAADLLRRGLAGIPPGACPGGGWGSAAHPRGCRLPHRGPPQNRATDYNVNSNVEVASMEGTQAGTASYDYTYEGEEDSSSQTPENPMEVESPTGSRSSAAMTMVGRTTAAPPVSATTPPV